MAGNKKPARKAAVAKRPRVALAPMMRETHDGLAMELHTAVLTLISAPSVLAWNQVMKKLEVVTLATSFLRKRKLHDDRDPLANALRTLLWTLNAAGERHDRTGVMTVTEAEARSIKVAAAEMDRAMAKIPANLYRACLRHAAEEQLRMHVAKMQEQERIAA